MLPPRIEKSGHGRKQIPPRSRNNTEREAHPLEPKKKDPFRIEEDWFAFLMGILIALGVFVGWIRNVPW
jgi:hypothetical protein